MNDHQKKRFAQNIVSTLFNTVNGKKIAFLGWAFKKDTNDTRESAAIYVADELVAERAEVTVYDPKVSRAQMLGDLNYLATRAIEENDSLLKIAEDAYEACEGAHAIAVLTEWDEFKELDWQNIYQNMAKPAFVFDGRAILRKADLEKIGFQVYRIGKH
jgi:UDPglucose 6-dehydrogenase